MTPGDLVGHYRILSHLGRGGIGEVFLAEDLRLGRRIALKVLPPMFAADPRARERFEREARAVAALNHPHIVTIYSVEEADGRPFLTMEFVDGRRLSDLIAPGGLPLDEILRIGGEVADAVAAAQARGITHRDLKPGNIMIAADGRVKVLDFGLARIREAELADVPEQLTRTASELTGEGSIVGTVAYMSPEQAEGKAVDSRSDIFSLGVVLHEMATGQRPFQGDTNVSIISSILKDTPRPISEINPLLPADLSRIVRRCLAKDPARRYQTGVDLRNELEDLRQESSATAPVAAPSVPKKRWGVFPITVVAAALAIVGVGAWLLRPRAAATQPFTIDHVTRLTNTGTASLAAISRDGQYVVHVKREQGGASLWVRQTATTSDVRIVAAADVTYGGVVLSRDGVYAYYSVYPGSVKAGTAQLYRIPLLGGTPTALIKDVDSQVTFSPDGRMAFIRQDTNKGVTSLIVANADGTNVREFAKLDAPWRFQPEAPSWSPDGRTIAATGIAGSSGTAVFLVDTATAVAKQLGDRWANALGVQWAPDGHALFICAFDPGATLYTQIWRIEFPSGRRERVTRDADIYSGVSISGDGRTIATVQKQRVSGLEASALDGSSWHPLTPVSARVDGFNGIAVLGDGRLVYTGMVSDLQQLWIAQSDGSDARPLTSGAMTAMWPEPSPDGRWIYFQAMSSTGSNIERVALDGSGMTAITHGGAEMAPISSADGRVVYLTQLAPAPPHPARVPATGGDPVALTRAPFVTSGVSTGGDQLQGLVWDPQAGEPVVATLSIATGKIQSYPVVTGGYGGMVPAFLSGGILYFHPHGTPARLHLRAPDGTDRAVGPPIDDTIWSGRVSPDEHTVVLSHGRLSSDVVLISSTPN